MIDGKSRLIFELQDRVKTLENALLAATAELRDRLGDDDVLVIDGYNILSAKESKA